MNFSDIPKYREDASRYQLVSDADNLGWPQRVFLSRDRGKPTTIVWLYWPDRHQFIRDETWPNGELVSHDRF